MPAFVTDERISTGHGARDPLTFSEEFVRTSRTPPDDALSSPLFQRERERASVSSVSRRLSAVLLAPRGLSVLVVWSVVVVVWLTLGPLSPGGERSPIRLTPPRNPVEVFGNLVLLAPAALASMLRLAHSRVRESTRLLLVVAGGALVSICVELSQLGVAGRIVSPYDVALNSAGAALAAGLALRLERRSVRAGLLSLAIFGLVFAAVLAYMSRVSHVVARDFTLAGWDESVEIVAGAEADGGRIFRGEVRDGRICTGPSSWTTCAGAHAPAAERRALADAAERSQRVRIAASVRSASDGQSGPARILTFSESADERNLTIGQSGRALVFRVRTPVTGENGARPELRLPGAIQAGAWTEVAAEFDRGKVTLSASGAPAAAKAVMSFDLLTAWLLRHGIPAVGPEEVRRGRLVAGLLLMMPVGLLAGALVSGRLASGAAGAIAGVVLLAGVQLAVGRWPSIASAVVTGGVAAAVAFLVSNARRRVFALPPASSAAVSGPTHSAVAPPQ